LPLPHFLTLKTKPKPSEAGLVLKGRRKEQASSRAIVLNKIEAQRSGFDFERKREIADMELSRRLRKPGKRNATGFF
jgi:hypothetical protein